MSIVGGNPESGVRIEIERPAGGGPPWLYEGEAVTSEERFPVRAVVEADGTVVFSSERAPPELLEKARLIVRAAHKNAREADEGAPPPRRIIRWRGQK
jgi:hypothetical protein